MPLPQVKLETTVNSIETKVDKAEPKKQNIPEPKVASTDTQYGVTLRNLKSLKDQAREKLLANQESKAQIHIEDENLKLVWANAIEFLASDKMVYKSAISESDITFHQDDITIHATTVALDFLKPERLRLLDFFKKAYHNEAINVLFQEKIVALNEGANKVLSTKEIYEKMASKNPHLKNLRDLLRLDLEL
jgi:hypothetical protein